jgi:hypothetical protein
MNFEARQGHFVVTSWALRGCAHRMVQSLLLQGFTALHRAVGGDALTHHP